MAISKAVLAKEVDGVINYIYPKTTADMVEYDASQSVEEKIQTLEDTDIPNALSNYYTKTQTYTKDEIDDLFYTPIAINSVSLSPNTAEKGTTQSVTVSWDISRKPVSMTVNGSSVTPVASGSTSVTGVSDTRSITVTATDQGLHSTANSAYTASKSATITFYYPIYTGSAAAGTYNESFITGLSGKKIGTYNGSYTVNVATNQYLFYACPASVSPSFAVGGFSGGFEQVASSISHKGTTYKLFKSQNPSLGSTTVVVS